MVRAENRANKVSNRPLESRNLLRLGAAGLIPRMLQERGIRADAAFGRTENQRQWFADPERVVPLALLGLVFESVVAATALTEFGLMVGLRAGSQVLGRNGTPEDAEPGAALMRIISRGASFPNSLLSVSISGEKCTIECVNLPGSLVARDQLADCAVGFAAGVLRVLCGRQWRPAVFRFAHRQPPDPLRYTALLQAPVLFEAGISALEFESAWLGRDDAISPRPPDGDHHERHRRRDLVGQINAILAAWTCDRKTLGTGGCFKDGIEATYAQSAFG